MTLSIDDKHVDTAGLWAQAYRLHRFNLGTPARKIFFKLLRARLTGLIERGEYATNS